MLSSAITSHTKILKPLIAVRTCLIAPVLAARMAASLDYISNGRALLNIVKGGATNDLKATGDPLANAHDERYERTVEFLQIIKGVWENSRIEYQSIMADTETDQGQQKMNFKGTYYELEEAASFPPPVQSPHPPIYFAGSSPAARKVAAEFADVYLFWAEPLEWVEEQIKELEHVRGQLSEQTGVKRRPRYGMRAQVLVRDTEEAAWKAAWQIISK
ncbi:LLM class flavin-dependent oxidoreductase [Paenibacillus periandrae]|uniref:LLM class flavin-dependent oxidoreductase n=1 Tax=Paenibacillus periandrae TaxID=1761741 RepID=UPI0030842830